MAGQNYSPRPARTSSRSRVRSTSLVITIWKMETRDSVSGRRRSKRLAHLTPALFRLAGLLERFPNVLEKEPHVLAGYGCRVPFDDGDHVERRPQRDPETLSPRRHAAGAGCDLVAAVSKRPDEAEFLRALDELGVSWSPQRSTSSVPSTTSGFSSVKGAATARVNSRIPAADRPGVRSRIRLIDSRLKPSAWRSLISSRRATCSLP